MQSANSRAPLACVIAWLAVGALAQGSERRQPTGPRAPQPAFDITKLYPPDPQTGSDFGDALAFAGDQLLVGAKD